MEIQTDEEFSRTMRNLGNTVLLQKLTDFSWDTVHVFNEGTSAELVNRRVGQPVLTEDSFYSEGGQLFVFTADGNVVEALSVVPDLLVIGRQHTWGAKVRVEAGQDGGAYRLVEPGAAAERAQP